MNLKEKFIIIVIPILFFIVSFLTISDYGISWDEPAHFMRGQAYLNYFLSGSLDYQNLKPSDRQSAYQYTSYDAKFFLKNDSGHPPVNGILAAFSNYIFYQKLGILGDIESFHLFNILASTLLVFIVTVFAVKSYGLFVGLIAGISIAIYPLFFSEGHFNIKDPIETTFFSATIWCFYNSLKNLNWRWLLLSTAFFALAFGTKFNILFVPFIIFPWLFFRYRLHELRLSSLSNKIKIPWNFLLFLILSPIIIGAFFFFAWPYLWSNPINNILSIFRYYEEIGTGGRGQTNFLVAGGFNFFPAIWIIITTPPVILFFSVIGIVYSIISSRWEKEKTSLLWLLWLIVPILRVSAPNSSIYGGVRQIMEFIPAMALLAGIGALTFTRWLGKIYPFNKLSGKILAIFVLFMFMPHFWVMKQLHPNENVYFNFLIGGLPGAQKMNIPYWGNSFGNAYLQAVNWLNVHGEVGSKLALVQNTMVNIPKEYIRSDINFSNAFWSGINRKGEYLMELTHQGSEVAYPFAWEYVNRVLIPVYEVKVDGVPIAKVWKNDIKYSKKQYQIEQDVTIKNVSVNGNILEVELDNITSLARIIIQFNPAGNCEGFKKGTVRTSVNKTNWQLEDEKIGDTQVNTYSPLEGGLARFIFPAHQAKYIEISTNNSKSCLFQNPQVTVRGFN